MNAIVICSRNYGIGSKGKLIATIPKDQEYFKQLTIGKVVIMGRKTYESLPKSKQPLPDRINIIMTRDENYNLNENENIFICHNIDQCLNRIIDLHINDDDVFVIGGSEIYKQFLHLCNKIYMTRVYCIEPYDEIEMVVGADTYFPSTPLAKTYRINEDQTVDIKPMWKITSKSTLENYGKYQYEFITYERDAYNW